LQCAGGDLDKGVFWNESQRSRHAYLSVNAPPKLRVSRLGFLENSGTASGKTKPRSGPSKVVLPAGVLKSDTI
jgi:hypothetical protein